MNGWERNGKRACKILIWVVTYFTSCWALGVQHSFGVMGVVLICGFIDSMMDIVWPTHGHALTSQPRESEAET